MNRLVIFGAAVSLAALVLVSFPARVSARDDAAMTNAAPSARTSAKSPATQPAADDQAVYTEGAALFSPAANVPAGDRMARVRAWAPKAARRLASADARQIALEQEVFAATGRMLPDLSKLNDESGSLFDQIQALELQRAGTDARASEVDRQIQSSRQPKDPEEYQNDMTAWESAKAVLATRKKALDDARVASPRDANAVAQLERSVSDATAEVALRWRRVVEARGGDVTDALVKQLAQIKIEQQDYNARINFLQRRLDALRRVGDAIERDVRMSNEDTQISLWLGQARSAQADAPGGGN